MANSTQQFVPIKEIRDDIVVLKSGELRAVLLCQAINLDLKSSDEQTATILQFQNFLNALEFSIQITASSRRLDIRPYILKLEKRLEEIEGDLLRIQTAEYTQFIQRFNETYDIMSKYFYIIIPYGSQALAGEGLLKGLLGKKNNQDADAGQFEEYRTQINQRVSVVMSGLSSLGLECKQLETPELIELYQKTFNPGELHSTAGALGQS